MLRKLKDFEQSNPLAAYLEKEVVKADVRLEKIDAANAILPDDINIILDETKVPAVSGYCMLENGGSYISVKSSLPGVTTEMLQWMVAWQGQNPVNYMAINPATHHSAAISDVDREKIAVPFLSAEQKAQGIFVYSVDRMGEDFVETVASYLSPIDQGFCMDAFAAADVTVIGGYTLRQKHKEEDPQKKALTITLSVVKETEGGVDVHTHIWCGYKLLRREIKRFENNGIQPTEEFTEMLANYTADEWAQIGHILPELYKECC